MSNTNLIYLAVPYTHPDEGVKEYREDLVGKITVDKMNMGEIVYSPITYGLSLSMKHDLPTDWNFWEKFCKTYISACDEVHVVMADGWEESEGVTNEIKTAERLGKPIKYIEVSDG